MGCRVATLGELSLDNGKYGIAAPAVDFDTELPAYLRITDINDDGALNKLDRKSVNDPNACKYMLSEGDIVFARTGNSTGRNYFYDPRDGKFAFAGFLVKFSLDASKVNPRFVKYYAQSRAYWDWVASFKTGSTRGNINAKTYAQMPIPLPERSTQNSIVALCDCISDKIRVNAQLNGYLAELAQTIYNDWFRDFGHWGGQMPSHWETGVLGDYVTVKRGGSPRPIQEYLSDEGLRWLKIADVSGISGPYILEIKEHIKEEGLRKTVHLEPGSLVLSNSATPGIPKILSIDTCIHDGWLYFPQSQFTNEWLYCYFLNVRQELVRMANGSVFQNLKTDIVKNFEVIRPDDETLASFQEMVAPLFNLMESCQKENKQLAHLRDTLLPKLISGEIDVSKVDLTQLNSHLA